MRKLANLLAVFSCFGLFAADEACVLVDADRVYAGDLRKQNPALAAVPADTPIGFSPIAGQRRVIRSRELARLLGRAVPADPNALPQVCIERRTHPLHISDFVSAIRRAFDGRTIDAEVIEFSKTPLPSGTLHFAQANLPAVPDSTGTILWRGLHLDISGRQTPVWVRARLVEKGCEQILRAEVRRGEAITSASLRVETKDRFPGNGLIADCELSKSVSRVARLDLRKGDRLTAQNSMPAPAVLRGDLITVEIVNPAMSIFVNGKAENSAEIGQRLSFSTGFSKQKFVGTAKGRKHAVLTMGK